MQQEVTQLPVLLERYAWTVQNGAAAGSCTIRQLYWVADVDQPPL